MDRKRPASGGDPRDQKRQDTGTTKPGGFMTDKPISVRTNYFPLEVLTDKTIFKYHFEFVGDITLSNPNTIGKVLSRTLASAFGVQQVPGEKRQILKKFVWGNSLFILAPIPEAKIGVVLTQPFEGTDYQIRLTGPQKFDFDLDSKGFQCIRRRETDDQEYEMVSRSEGSFVSHIVNILVKPVLYAMGLTPIGFRGFFDTNQRDSSDRYYDFTPGFNPVVVLHNKQLFLHTDFEYRAIAKDSVLKHIHDIEKSHERISVYCHYNRRHYMVSRVATELTPLSTFECKGVQKSYKHYYEDQYKISIKDLKQPLLEVTQRRKGGVSTIYLVPELCQTTGVPSKDLAQTRLPTTDTSQRFEKLSKFIKDFVGKAPKHPLGAAVKLSNDFFDPKARQLRPVEISFCERQTQISDTKAVWDDLLRNNSGNKLKAVPQFKWEVWVAHHSLMRESDAFVSTLDRLMGPLCPQGFSKPLVHPPGLDDMVARLQKTRPAVVLVVLGDTNAQMYAQVKNWLVQAGVPGQVAVTSKFMKGSNADMSKVTKAGLQLLTKGGGVLWSTSFKENDPLRAKLTALHTAVFGIERSIDKAHQTKSIAVTCSVDKSPLTFSEYWNHHAVVSGAAKDEVSLAAIVHKALIAFQARNNMLPGRLVFYSSGASEGAMKSVLSTDVGAVKSAVDIVYKGKQAPEIIYVIVCRRGTTRLFSKNANGTVQNVPPGTLVDSLICEANEFYLVSHEAGRKSVLPPKYIRAYCTEAPTLDMKDLQRLSYALCHVYYNWPGPISCPAPLKYADKLARLAQATRVPTLPEKESTLNTRLYYI